MTGARFVAASMVFLFHVATLRLFADGTGVSGALTSATKSAATVGVSFFFLLSGFVLTWSARPDDTYRGFLRRRLVKIYPNHAVTFGLAMLVFAAASTPWSTALLNLLLLQAWVPKPDVFLSVNGPSWSLSCELFFYAMFPLLLPRLARIRAGQLWACAAGVAGTVIALPVLGSLLPASPRFPEGFAGTVLADQSVDQMWFLYAFPPVRLLDFVLGMLMARIVLTGRWVGPGRGVAFALTVVGYLVGLIVPMTYTVNAVLIVPLALLVPALAVGDDRAGRSWLSSPVMRRLGEASFAFYLVHEIVLIVLRAGIGFDRELGRGAGLLFVALAFLLSLGLAVLLHRLVESPAMRRWGRPPQGKRIETDAAVRVEPS
ncbi:MULTISPECIES: acyltransferase family protein [Micromonospora]|uniref:Acyltransferase n=1 Tax=Micromonospora antibiotica TaxID=2807623 RepID=A0ABS3V2A5_9ACTN|nr:acyltransferase [Micromonospora antibiotica]MBO4159740.1 acyltransferase [Micromonospora antibiotica]